MTLSVCTQCMRPLPAFGANAPAPTACPFCSARLDAGRGVAAAGSPAASVPSAKPATAASAPRRAPAPPAAASATPPPRTPAPTLRAPGNDPTRPADPRGAGRDLEAVGKKRSEAFASALADSAGRITPVHSFAVPPEAIPSRDAARRQRTVAATAAAPAPSPQPVTTPPPAGVAPAASARTVPAPLATSPTVLSLPTTSPPVASARAVSPVTPSPSPAPAAASPSPSPIPSPSPSPIPSPSPRHLDAFAAATAEGAPDEPLPISFSDSVPVDLRPRWAGILSRVPTRGLGAAIGAAVIVVLLGAGGIKLFSRVGRPPAVVVAARSPAVDPPTPAHSAPPPAPVAPTPASVVAAREPAAPRAPAPPAAEPEPEPQTETAPPRATTVASENHSGGKSPHVHAVHRGPARKARGLAAHANRHSPPASVARRRLAVRSAAPAASDAPMSEADKLTRARDSYRQGNERLFVGDAAAAIKDYEEAIRLNPRNVAGYRGLGLANAQLGKRTEAVRYLRIYLKRAPDADDRALISNRISLLQTAP
jgi:hypothetical protein